MDFLPCFSSLKQLSFLSLDNKLDHECIKISKTDDPPLSFIAFFQRFCSQNPCASCNIFWKQLLSVFLKETLVLKIFQHIFQLCFNYFNYVFLQMEILKHLVEFVRESPQINIFSKSLANWGPKKTVWKNQFLKNNFPKGSKNQLHYSQFKI